MAEFFQPGTAESMIKIIGDLNTQWSEGVPPEAMADIAKQGVSVINNGKNVAVQYVSPDGYIKQLETTLENFPNTSASQALEAYKNAGGKVSYSGTVAVASNKIASGGKVITYEVAGAAGTAKTAIGGILSMNLPTAAAAIAPVAGVALGAGLYSLNPELWTKISKTMLPFCYEDTELLPVVYDEDGRTYFPKEAVDAVKTVVEPLISQSVTDSSNFPEVAKVTPFPFSFAYTSESSFGESGVPVSTPISSSVPAVHVVNLDNLPYLDLYLFSKEPFRYGFTAGSGGPNQYEARKTGSTSTPIYMGHINYDFYVSEPELVTSGTTNLHFNGVSAVDIGQAIMYESAASAPEGLTKWTGVQYPLNPEGIGVVTRIGENGEILQTNPYYPITVPTGEPGVSVDPTISDLTNNNNPDKAIDPWLKQDPSPSTYPDGVPQSNSSPIPDDTPNYEPNINPNDDPSQKPQTKPEGQPSPTDPTDDGTTLEPQIPLAPSISGAKGLIHVYNPTMSAVQGFGEWLWTTFSGNIIDTVSKLFNNPMEAVIGLHELYVKPNISSTDTIKAGYLDSNISSEVVGNRYSSLNCGSVVVPEWYQNYLDYSPYTKCFAYLPFIGMVPLAADDIIGSAVNITYHIDSYTGACIAIITTARNNYSAVTYQFEGNCASELPITSGYQSTLMAGLLGIAGTAISGNPHVGLATANLGRATLGKNEVNHSGSFGSSYGAMGLKNPYILVKRPTQKVALNYNILYGLPAHKVVTIGDCSGYLRAREVHVQSPTATNEEKALIENLLKEGVIVQ